MTKKINMEHVKLLKHLNNRFQRVTPLEVTMTRKWTFYKNNRFDQEYHVSTEELKQSFTKWQESHGEMHPRRSILLFLMDYGTYNFDLDEFIDTVCLTD